VLESEERMTKAKTSSPLTRNQKKKMSEIPSEVKLRKIIPEVPRDDSERVELLEDLQVMGCSGFLEKPWGFKDDRVVRATAGRGVERVRKLNPGAAGQVDGGNLARGVSFRQRGCRISGEKGRIREGLLQGFAQPQGRIRH
jgi:hypothetical protein